MQSRKKIILGVDPGFGRLGIAVLEKDNKEKLIYSDCFETQAKKSHPERLLLIGEEISRIIKKYSPQVLSIETLLFGKNQKTAMQVAQARGVIIYEAKKNNLEVREFNPNQIKLAVTGYGKSDKKQIIQMIPHLIKIPEKKRRDDEYDAIAAALTCAAISLSTESRK